MVLPPLLSTHPHPCCCPRPHHPTLALSLSGLALTLASLKITIAVFTLVHTGLALTLSLTGLTLTLSLSSLALALSLTGLSLSLSLTGFALTLSFTSLALALSLTIFALTPSLTGLALALSSPPNEQCLSPHRPCHPSLVISPMRQAFHTLHRHSNGAAVGGSLHQDHTRHRASLVSPQMPPNVHGPGLIKVAYAATWPLPSH